MVVVSRPERWSGVLRFPTVVPQSLRGGVGTIGNFDGVHLGHRAILSAMRHSNCEGARIVVSFYPHPASVVRPHTTIPEISPIREKTALLSHEGVDLLYLVHFTQCMARWSAAKFIHEVFVSALNLQHLVIGEDAAFGKGREGDVTFLARELPKVGIGLTVVPHLMLGEVRPSSRRIREMLTAGDIHAAGQLLGRFHTVVGRVVHGDSRGAKLGFPTANLALGERILPKNGVYACIATIEGRSFPAVTNIGTRPTFGGEGVRVEAHLMDQSGSPIPQSLYGRRLSLSFLARLRDEEKFSSVEALTVQIRLDCDNALAQVNKHLP